MGWTSKVVICFCDLHGKVALVKMFNNELSVLCIEVIFLCHHGDVKKHFTLQQNDLTSKFKIQTDANGSGSEWIHAAFGSGSNFDCMVLDSGRNKLDGFDFGKQAH